MPAANGPPPWWRFRIPEPEKNQVLLKVSPHCGVCGSDLHAWLNHPGYESVLPEVTFGHELSGSVVSTGPEAGDWNEGDCAVMIALQTSHDPNDRYCVDGLPQLSPRRRSGPPPRRRHGRICLRGTRISTPHSRRARSRPCRPHRTALRSRALHRQPQFRGTG